MEKSLSVLIAVGCIGGLISLVCNMALEWLKQRRVPVGEDKKCPRLGFCEKAISGTEAELSAQKALCDERSGNILKRLDEGRSDFKQIGKDLSDIKGSISALVAVAEERARSFRKE